MLPPLNTPQATARAGTNKAPATRAKSPDGSPERARFEATPLAVRRATTAPAESAATVPLVRTRGAEKTISAVPNLFSRQPREDQRRSGHSNAIGRTTARASSGETIRPAATIPRASAYHSRLRPFSISLSSATTNGAKRPLADLPSRGGEGGSVHCSRRGIRRTRLRCFGGPVLVPPPRAR